MNLDEITRITEAATAGPWEADCFADWGDQPQSAVFADSLPLTSDNQSGHVFKQADAAFIAMARNEMPALIERVKKLEADLERSKSGGRTLGQMIKRQCDDIVKITDSAHLIDETGDGDWGLVWERGYDMRAKHDELIAERDAALARIAAVEAAIVKGSLMDVIPTRMVPATAMESEQWWQNWHMQADARWRANLRAALTEGEADERADQP